MSVTVTIPTSSSSSKTGTRRSPVSRTSAESSVSDADGPMVGTSRTSIASWSSSGCSISDSRVTSPRKVPPSSVTTGTEENPRS